MTTVLVEGPSDARAVEVLARRRGRDLGAVRVESMGGVTNLGRWLGHSPAGERVILLHDAGETAYVERAVTRSKVPVERFVCDADLEDELIRALGLAPALTVVEAAGDLELWQRLTRQPAHRERPPATVLRRFLGTTSGRKLRYAELLVEAAVELDCVPEPLDAVLTAATS